MAKLNNEERQNLTNWVQILHDPEKSRGPSARLRRCPDLMSVMLCEDFHSAMPIFDSYQNRQPEVLAAITALLAHARDGYIEQRCSCCGGSGNCHSQSIKAFPTALAQPFDPGGKRSPLSPARFHRLIGCDTMEDFFTQLRRALALIKFAPPMISLTNSIFQWDEDQRTKSKTNFAEHLKYQWTAAYYAAREANNIDPNSD